MNLIEQLGGYDAAKEYLKENSHFINFEGLERFYDALLQYRRQHNIFEVGDKVVFEAHFCDGHEGLGYGEITYCTMDKRVFEIDNYYLISIDEIRHATDLEIEAGRRLSKIKCWSCDKEMSHSDRAENDGFCIHCNAEIEL